MTEAREDRKDLTLAKGVQENVSGVFHEHVEIGLAWRSHTFVLGSTPDQAAKPADQECHCQVSINGQVRRDDVASGYR